MNDRQAPIRRNPREVHDFWPRVLASPFLGALVVNLSGLIDHGRHSTAELVALVRLVRACRVRRVGRQPAALLPAAAPRGLAAAAVEPPRRAAGAHQPLHDPGVARPALAVARRHRRSRHAPLRVDHRHLRRRRVRRGDHPCLRDRVPAARLGERPHAQRPGRTGAPRDRARESWPRGRSAFPLQQPERAGAPRRSAQRRGVSASSAR